ncbi:MAG: sulfurtransferase [Rhodocyclaceae bacterium]|jgi:thiosulfate/3-mercaptopyruvate sulfurtransferase|nr:sulfurtransferase [Thiobacillus sp.]NWG30416.1 sulfurtransferase [Rhodocyclaceae bacterium]
MKQLMNLGRALGMVAAFLFSLVTAALAAEPLVDVAWLKANLGKPDIVIVDIQPASDFLRGHIPGAANTDFAKSGWREDRADKVPDMLPAKFDKLAAHIGSLGVDNSSHVILVAPGSSYLDMGWATRIYWTFKTLGHDNVSILNGGMAAWTKDKANPLETGAAKVAAKTFTPHPRMDMLATVDDVKAAIASKKAVLVDSRPEDQFSGINRNPKASENGTLPGAKNLPTGWFTENGGGMFRDKATIEKLYKHAGVSTAGEQINFCNTGHLASIGWFVSSELLGNKKAKLYDGSMTEWTLTKAGPVEQHVKLQ